ncbi:LysR family transcriptional regulator [Salinisphaera hydrothermalis]|uniref:LysR family transcriptional regulator n=1 Tax=Salinisphaera hydrothermalis (strain C41B8) TaxID=1304275 RepID=A0A084IQJ3_SALHC|nr:LysR family transcriptional regulator [Salinisphaera hydrothermalis]KEZ78977.1 LysR family transcriptional regulator [Salinisphaera hydrothermalis C41B8]
MDRADLAALQTFVTIADQGSLRAAARVLGVNPPAVSHQLKAFETRLGTPLFLRTTRALTLTDAGRAVYDGSAHLLNTVEETLEAVRDVRRARAGRLRITLPFRAWQLIIAPRIDAFQAAYPRIELDLTIDEALVDLAAHGFHAGIRLGDYLQDTHVAVGLSESEPGAYVASPQYLERNGVPATPRDLLDHDCIRHRRSTSRRMAEWRFMTSEGEFAVEPHGRLIFNDLRTVVAAARQGLGIGWSLKRGVQAQLESGSLVQVLETFTPTRPGFCLYYPRSVRQLGLLRAFIEHFRLH